MFSTLIKHGFLTSQSMCRVLPILQTGICWECGKEGVHVLNSDNIVLFKLMQALKLKSDQKSCLLLPLKKKKFTSVQIGSYNHVCVF